MLAVSQIPFCKNKQKTLYLSSTVTVNSDESRVLILPFFRMLGAVRDDKIRLRHA